MPYEAITSNKEYLRDLVRRALLLLLMAGVLLVLGLAKNDLIHVCLVVGFLYFSAGVIQMILAKRAISGIKVVGYREVPAGKVAVATARVAQAVPGGEALLRRMDPVPLPRDIEPTPEIMEINRELRADHQMACRHVAVVAVVEIFVSLDFLLLLLALLGSFVRSGLF